MKFIKFFVTLCLTAFLAIAIMVPADAAKRGKYKETAVTDGGSVKGKVSFTGDLPEDAIENILITKNTDVCGQGERKVVWVDVEQGALRGVFVFIDKIKQGKNWENPKGGNYMVIQKGCRFRPWAQVVRPGPFVIRNSDTGVLHNINARELIGVEKGRIVKKTLFNFGQPDPGDIKDKIKPRRSSYIAINCEAHNFMFGFMFAPVHPYAVVVGEDGSFSIDNIPPGEYTLKAWHPRFGIKKAKITVSAKAPVNTDFEFSQ